MRKIFFCALLLPSLFAVQAIAANLLSNPGFEADLKGQTSVINGWSPYGGNAYSETSGTVAHSGTNYFKVYQAFNSQVNYTGVYQSYVSGPGAVYSANGWAFSATNDAIAGQNVAWIEVTFRDQNANILALYRSSLINTSAIASKSFPLGTWVNLPVTNQYNPNNYVITNTTSYLVAPSNTLYMSCQIVFQGDANNSGGSMYFDDLSLTQISGAPYGNMNIVWSDEFNGSSINHNVWTYDLGGGGWGNSELEYYTNSANNAYVSNGFLHIVARQQSAGGENYTSARIKSEGLFWQTYGRVEWRAKLPQGTGTWPALWMLGTNISTVGWPGCGEIDVVENPGTNSGYVQGSLHSGSDETAIYNFINDSVTNFHTYTLDWTSNAFLYYVDGHLYETQTSWGSSTSNPYPYPFNQPFFFLMNLAIGGSYLGYPGTNQVNAGTTFPCEMVVDYLRLYSVTPPLQLTAKRSGTNVLLTWPTNIVCQLQAQTNVTSLGSNWVTLSTTNGQLQINPKTKSGFYRLVSP